MTHPPEGSEGPRRAQQPENGRAGGPTVRGGGSDVDHRLVEHRQQWDSKPVLRGVYGDFHNRLLAACRPGRTLDIGAGSGHMDEADQSVVALDILHAPWLDVVGDAEALPFKDRTFDNIVMLDVLHHLANPRLFFAEAARVLTSGGRIVMIEPGITPLSWPFYKWIHPEPVIMTADPLADASEGSDPWDSNQAIPTKLFARREGRDRFHREFAELRVRERRWLSLFAYPLSGGFRSWSLVPARAVPRLLRWESFLLPVIGPVMAFRLFVVVERAYH